MWILKGLKSDNIAATLIEFLMLNVCYVRFETMCRCVTVLPFCPYTCAVSSLTYFGLSDNPHISVSSMPVILEGGVGSHILYSPYVYGGLQSKVATRGNQNPSFSLQPVIILSLVYCGELCSWVCIPALLLECGPLIFFHAENGLGICAWGFYSNAGLQNQTQFFLPCVLFCYNLYNLRVLIMGLLSVIFTRYRGCYVTVKSFVLQLWGSDQELKLVFIQM